MSAKRNLVLLGAVAALAAAMANVVMAFKPPERALLPDFDRRLAVPAPDPGPVPNQQDAIAALTERVPGLNVRVDPLLGTPSFFSSSLSFLTGPTAQGLAVGPGTAQAIPATDPHRAVKAFLNEHAGMLTYGAEALNTARVNRDYVTPHNGLQTVVWQQQVDGIAVYQAVIIGNISRHGELVNLATHFVTDPLAAADAGVANRAAVAAAPPVPAAQAVVNAAGTLEKNGLALPQVVALDQPRGTERIQTFQAPPALQGTVSAQLAWVPVNRGALKLCWQVVLVSGRRGEMFLFLVDAVAGDVIVRRNLTRYLTDASYRVYTGDSPSPFTPGWPTPNTNQPPVIARSLLTTAALNTNASPNGWINDGDNSTLGNNVDAFIDRNGDMQPDVPRPQGVPFRVFDFPQDLNTDPTNYIESSIVQLFYINNRFHDFMYGFGFTEAAGNFQTDNFGRGGLGQDAIIAMSLFGESVGNANNAAMSTPPDGTPALMVMFVFDGPTPRRDSSLDSEVILHEHTHGITERTIGGGIGVNYFGQSGAIHEGNSDFFSMTTLSEPGDDLGGVYPAGGYLTYDILYPFIPRFRENYYFGIRRYPYSTNLLKNPLTYKDIDPTQASTHPGVPLSPVFGGGPADEVHNAGEVWCIVLWEMRVNLVARHGWTNGNTLALQLAYDGMRLSPPNPNFLELRDAILQADLVNNGGVNQLEIWRAFTKRGMGGSATSPPGSTCVGVVEAYDLPGLNYVSIDVDDSLTGNGNGTVDYNECAELNILLRNGIRSTASNTVAILTTTNALVTVVEGVAAYPPLAGGALGINLTPFRIYTAPEFPCGTPIWFELVISSSQDIRTNRFVLNTGYISLNANRFDNNTARPIPDNNTNGVDSAVDVFGFTDRVGRVTVSLYLEHANTGDLDVKLIAPDGTAITLVRNRGGFGTGFGLDCAPVGSRTTFDDRARVGIDQAFQPYVGTFRPEEPLSTFKGRMGSDVNGRWKLRVTDRAEFNVGTLRCWTLTLFPISCIEGRGPCAPDLAVTAIDQPDPVFVGSNLTYTVTVTNLRPVEARGVMLTNVVPAGVILVSVTPSQGTYNLLDGVLRFSLGTLGLSSNVTVTIVVRPTVAGTLTSVFSVGSAHSDFNLANNFVATTTTVTSRAPQLVAAGAELTAESVPSSGIEPGESVTVSLALRNVGTASTTNLVATLLAGNGIASPTGAGVYGVLLPGGVQAQPFGFVANGPAGSTISAELQLRDGTADLGTVQFHFVLSAEDLFVNPNAIEIVDASMAVPYPATLNVSNLVGLISSVKITLSKFTHRNHPADVDVLLVGPGGQAVVLMSDAGGGFAVTNVTLTFDSAASVALPDQGRIANGVYRPTDFPPADVFPAPAPGGPYANSFEVFKATDPNGQWQLYIYDDAPLDNGSISGGWMLHLTTVSPLAPPANLALTVQDSPDPVPIGSRLTYTLRVENLGPSPANEVVLSSQLSANATWISATNAHGSFTNSAGVLLFGLGTLSNRATASVIIEVEPTGPGTVTNTVQVSANELDLNLANNAAVVTTTATLPMADLGVSGFSLPVPALVGSPLTYVVTVTNRGPQDAPAVRLTNGLPASVAFVSAIASPGSATYQGGQVICDFGRLAPGGVAHATIVVTPGASGFVTNEVSVGSAAIDTLPDNDRLSLATLVSVPVPVVVAAGTALIHDANNNQSIDPGELVTVSLGLRNAGTAATTNLMATLMTTNQVVPVLNVSQSYGALFPAGPLAARSFSFTNTAASGATITAVLHLQDGTRDLGIATFPFALSSQQSFSNPGLLVIPLYGQASPYPATNLVSGLAGLASKVTVTLHELSHSFPEDLDMLLVGPSGQKTLLMSDAGGGNSVANLTLTFDDAAPNTLPMSNPLVSGSFRPTDYAPGDSFPAPAPGGLPELSLSVFNGINPNGTWSLYVNDDSGGDQGTIAGGWSLAIDSATPIPGAADLVVSTVASTNVAAVRQPLWLQIGVTNYGPATATDVLLTNTLPAGASVLTNQSSLGTFHLAGTELVSELGTLAAGQGVVRTIALIPTLTGTQVNTAQAGAREVDPNRANNVSVTILTVTEPVSGPLVVAGSVWNYFDRGTNAGPAWTMPGFNDSSWPSGPALLGYGRDGLGTVVSGGPPTNRYITTYFRHAFPVSNPGIYSNLTLRVLRDDGAVVYLNGTEVFRDNLPAGALDEFTLASVEVTGQEEDLYYAIRVDAALLASGTNVVAVEIHQRSATSFDAGFDLELLGNASVSNLLPSVTLLHPAPGAVLPANQLEFTAAAVDSDGVVLRVEYFTGTNKLGEDSVPPYQVARPDLAPGDYTLVARATDNSAQSSDSAPVSVTIVKSPDELIAEGAVWRYVDNGLDQGTNWVSLNFDDRYWASGQAELGFGGLPLTELNPGPSTNQFITYYFRGRFVVPAETQYAFLQLDLKRDDGAVVHLNGREVLRQNMPQGTVNFSTHALTNVALEGAETFYTAYIDAASLQPGTNILAVEVHQAGTNSSSLAFDLRLSAFDEPVPLVSGPIVAAGSVWKYLDRGTNAGFNWQQPSFDDSAWAIGPAILGYGRADLATAVNSGMASNYFVTTYFRRTFEVPYAGIYLNLALRLLREDGAVAYLNSVEVFRSNMPRGTVDETTYALSETTGLAENLYFETAVNPALLTNGLNLLAVEVHRFSPLSEALAFDLELGGNNGSSYVEILPRLRIEYAGGALILSWPATFDGYVLEFSSNLGSTALWELVDEPVMSDGLWHTVTVSPGAGATGFYRLRGPP